MPPRINWSVNWSVQTQRVTTSGSLLEAYPMHVASRGRLGVGLLLSRELAQGVVTPVDTVVRATTAVTFRSQGHGGF